MLSKYIEAYNEAVFDVDKEVGEILTHDKKAIDDISKRKWVKPDQTKAIFNIHSMHWRSHEECFIYAACNPLTSFSS